jgi:ComF family protein
MPSTNYHLNRENEFHMKLQVRLPFKFVMAKLKFMKDGKVQRLLHQLKYNGHHEIGTMLGRMYGFELIDAGYKNEFDLIIPVPLHVSRMRKRGYNQSAMFGNGLAEVLNIPCVEGIVKRRRKTETQTKKTRLNRWENVNEVFELADPERIHKRKILLVDDVITTGATLEACARVIVQHNCESISIACIAAAQ